MALEIQGIDIVTRVREVGDTTWLDLVCEIDSQIQLTNDTTQVDTKCGTFNGVKQVKGNYSGNAVYNTAPDGTQVSWNQIATWQVNNTLLEFLIENSAYTASDGSSIAEGAALHVFSTGRFVDSTFQEATGDIGKFSWTFKPTGIPTIGGASA